MNSIVTTISEPTKCMVTLSEKHNDSDNIIVTGDKKGPKIFNLKNCKFYSLDEQLHLDFELAKLLPTGHN